MPFSLRLTADLTIAIACRVLRGGSGRPLIVNLSPGGQAEGSSEEVSTDLGLPNSSDLQGIVRGSRFQSPIVWIGGPEPLALPDTPRIANALAASRRHVFVETSGVPLKPRLHELQPSSRLHIVVHFDRVTLGNELPRNSGSHPGLEALRFARLSGFFTCARINLSSSTEFAALEHLQSQIDALDVDGTLISPSTPSPEVARTVSRLRRQLLTRRWALLSRMLDSASRSSVLLAAAQERSRNFRKSQPDNFSEEAQAG